MAERTEGDPEEGGSSDPPSQHGAVQPDLPCHQNISGPSGNNFLCLFQGKYEERFLKDETISQQINSVESLPDLHLSQEDKKPEEFLQRKLRVSSRPPSKPTIVRGVTYYKAQSTESENDIEEQCELGMQPWLVGWWLHPIAKSVPHPLGMCGQSLWEQQEEVGQLVPHHCAAFELCMWGSVALLFHGKSLVAKEIGRCFGLKPNPASTPFQK